MKTRKYSNWHCIATCGCPSRQ